MKTKALLAALALIAWTAPSLAFAEGCRHDQQNAQISCAEGTTWDEATQTCVTASS